MLCHVWYFWCYFVATNNDEYIHPEMLSIMRKNVVFILYLLSKASWYWLLAYQYTYFYLTDLLEGTLIFKVLKEETFSDTSFLSYHWERNRNKWLEILNASNNLQKEECYRNLEGIFNLIWNYILNTCTNKNTIDKKKKTCRPWYPAR